ncbi:MAG TPA: hypothetical protein VK357_12965, partial [Rubrobacteraceae bacterium]|nr:hypothetical protein [Rubrobacteraceae bacterium]
LVCYRREVLTLKPLAAPRAACEALSVGFTPYLIIGKHPIVFAFEPSELPPDLVLLFTRTM